MRSVKYLEKVKEKYGITTDAALAAKLGIGKSAVSHYMKGLRVMDDNTIAAVAIALNLSRDEAMQLVSAAGIDRAEKTGQKSLWEVFMSRSAAIAASVLVASSVNLFLTPKDAEARTYSPSATQGEKSIYIMSNAISVLRNVISEPPRSSVRRPMK